MSKAKAPLRRKFWELPLDSLNSEEWEALCDGCGKCCLNKLEDEDTGEVVFTKVACRLLDTHSCQCSQYDIRHQFVPECIVFTPENIAKSAYFMPSSCAYRLRLENKPLPEWHPLISGDKKSVHESNNSVQDWSIPEFEVSEEDWEDHIIKEPH